MKRILHGSLRIKLKSYLLRIVYVHSYKDNVDVIFVLVFVKAMDNSLFSGVRVLGSEIFNTNSATMSKRQLVIPVSSLIML